MRIMFVLGNAGFKDFAQKPLISVKLMVLPNQKNLNLCLYCSTVLLK